jgi:hypothetical protein
MILETTNPKYFQRPQHSGRTRFYERPASQIYDGEHVSQASRDMTKGKAVEPFKDRAPNEKPIPSREPEPISYSRPCGSSLWLLDQSADAPLWLIRDRTTDHIFAQVRGSLVWVVNQMKIAAHQMGGQVEDLYYQRVKGHDA